METYLFKFSACLTVFWLVYILFLERQTMHRFKRFYLLAAIASALVIPTLTMTQYVEPTPLDLEVSTLYMPFQPSLIEQPQVQAPFFDLETVLWMLYGLGVFVFAIRFLVNLFKMYKRISVHEQIKKRSFIYVLLEDCRIPHSFFKYLFFERFKYENNSIPDEVKLHEETHARQLHSLDIIAIELLQILFWFHPLIYILKHHIKLNHEFLADQAVLNEGIDTKAYQTLLLQFSSNAHEYQLSSAINYSSIKKRFTVMKTQTSKIRIWVSSLLLLPVLAILFYSFAEKEYVEKENTKISEAIASELETANDLQLLYKDGATEAMMKEYNDWITHFNRTRHINNSTYQRIVAIYDLMTDTQKNTVEPYPRLPSIDLTRVEPKSPTEVQFDSWKEEKIFALWLDGNPIPNSELNNFTADDIVYFTGSKVLNNAMSESYPQPFQFNLYTKTGFTKTYQESGINDYRNITKTYALKIKDYLNGPQIENSELKILKIKADRLYNQFTKADITKYNILPAPPVPAQKQAKATAKQVAAYNTWAKSINEHMAKVKANNGVNTYPIVKIKDIKKYKAIYNIMTEAQKQASEQWPSFPPPPPPPPPAPKSKDKSDDSQNRNTIQPVEITIKKDKSLVLNGNSIKFEELNAAVNKLNAHLTIKEKRSYVTASIKLETNDSKDLAKKIGQELTKVDVFSNCIIFNNDDEQQKITSNHISPNAGLTIEEAKAQQEKDLKAYEESLESQKNKAKSPWAISMGVTSVEVVDESQHKQGPIEINGATYYFAQQNGKTTYYDSYGKVVDLNKIPPPPPIPNNATPEQKAKMKKATDAYMKANSDKVGKVVGENGETIEVIEVPEDLQGSIDINGETFYYTSSYGKTTYYNGSGKEVKMDNLPPPPPTSPAPKSKAKTEDGKNKNTTDIKALKVTEKRTEHDGIYYHYEIKNTGNTIIPANSYSVFLKVNGNTISFDKATSELKPGQTLKYKSEKTFYKKDHDVLNYALEIKMNDSNLENNILKGQSKF